MDLCKDLEEPVKKFHFLLPSLSAGTELRHGFWAKIAFSRVEIAERKRRGREQGNSHECVIQTQIKFLRHQGYNYNCNYNWNFDQTRSASSSYSWPRCGGCETHRNVTATLGREIIYQLC